MDTITNIVSLNISPTRLRMIADDMDNQLAEEFAASYSIIGDNGAVNLSWEGTATSIKKRMSTIDKDRATSYFIVEERKVATFEKKCNEMIKHGFIPEGGAVIRDGSWFRRPIYRQTFTYGVVY